jgi:1-acyl-sn-glycerol-3-phosphate acyltransferase
MEGAGGALMAYRRGDPLIRFTPGFVPFSVVFHIVLTLVRLADWLVFRLRVEGRRNLAGLKRALLVSNHTLILDPGIIAHAIRPRRTYFTMLEETALVPILGTFVRLLGGVPIPARAASVRALEWGLQTGLDELGLVHFFPEGDCFLRNQQIEAFHPGVFILALRLGLPVIPLTTVLRERRWPGPGGLRLLGRTVELPPRVSILIGPPFRPSPVSGGGSLRRAALEMAGELRAFMQSVVDSRGGCKTMGRGRMRRVFG